MTASGVMISDRAAWMSMAVLILDQLTKWAAFAAAPPGRELRVIPGITIGQTRNEGIAFGMFAGSKWLVLGLMGAALLLLTVFYARQRSRPVLWLATGLLMGGAIGNAVDRLQFGYVRDFIDPPAWPSFNVADIAITFGVVVLFVAIERSPTRDRHETSDRSDERVR